MLQHNDSREIAHSAPKGGWRAVEKSDPFKPLSRRFPGSPTARQIEKWRPVGCARGKSLFLPLGPSYGALWGRFLRRPKWIALRLRVLHTHARTPELYGFEDQPDIVNGVAISSSGLRKNAMACCMAGSKDERWSKSAGGNEEPRTRVVRRKFCIHPHRHSAKFMRLLAEYPMSATSWAVESVGRGDIPSSSFCLMPLHRKPSPRQSAWVAVLLSAALWRTA
jgi:hypothetical protein